MSSSNNIYSIIKKKPGSKTSAFFICLLVAGLLWLVKALNTIYTYQVKIPVEFKNIPQNKKPIHQIPEEIKVELKASGLKLFFVLLNQPFKQLEIDFNELKNTNKQQSYILSVANINFKKSLRFETAIKHISPDTIYFIEKSGYQKNVPVKVPLFLKCSPGYGYKQPIINPAFVTILGDSNELKRIDTVYTESLQLVNFNETKEKKMQVIKPNESVYSSVSWVNVKIEAGRLVEQSVYLPVDVLSTDDKIKSVNIFPSRVKVKFTSLQNEFNLSDTSMFKATINLHAINKATNKTPVVLSTQPGNINILGLEPENVEVLIIKK